ncbi:MAG: DUF1848 family protein [Methanomicrobiales archaeon]
MTNDLLVKGFGDDAALREFRSSPGQQKLTGTGLATDPSLRIRDPGQRNTFRCIVTKDIGKYPTCKHLCVYCYANTSPASERRNYTGYCEERDRRIFLDGITE